MKLRCRFRNAAAFALVALICTAALPAQNWTVYATGLNNPRGLTFGPDGYLYVAEGGAGGTTSTVGTCEQVPGPVGPYTGGFTSRISDLKKSPLACSCRQS
jgi:hypothetical protein